MYIISKAIKLLSNDLTYQAPFPSRALSVAF